jgi:hypothetical protein
VIKKIEGVNIIKVSNKQSVKYLNLNKRIISRLKRGCDITLKILKF